MFVIYKLSDTKLAASSYTNDEHEDDKILRVVEIIKI